MNTEISRTGHIWGGGSEWTGLGLLFKHHLTQDWNTWAKLFNY